MILSVLASFEKYMNFLQIIPLNLEIGKNFNS